MRIARIIDQYGVLPSQGLLTFDGEEALVMDGIRVNIVLLWKWLLADGKE